MDPANVDWNYLKVINISSCFRCFRKDAKNKELLFVGRICIVILVAISIAWIPIIQQMQGHKLDSTKGNGSDKNWKVEILNALTRDC